MAIHKHNRQYDLVVFGATGYTGKLAAEAIAKSLPTDLKWAIAGRSEAKLKAVAETCKALNPDRLQPAVEIADVSDGTRVKALVSKTFVFLAVVGPYCKYGEVAFKACAEAGTHYLDVTGESPWVLSMTRKYEAVAKASGAIMIPQSGLDSVPSDICTWQLATTLREELNVKTKDVVISSHKLKIIPSGGTISTVLSAFGVFSVDELRKGYEPYSQSPIPRNPSVKDPYSGITKALFGCFSVPDLGLLTSSPLGRTDATQVGRSWGLLNTIPSRKDQFYGDNFTWTPGMKARNWLAGVAIHWLQVSTLALLFLLPPLRTLAARFVTQPGEGASKEEAAKCETEYRGTATADSNTKKKAYIRAWYDGDGYTLTAIFLTQAALTVLEDDLELGGGVFTPACLGQAFVDRTEAQGFKTETQIMDH